MDPNQTVIPSEEQKPAALKKPTWSFVPKAKQVETAPSEIS